MLRTIKLHGELAKFTPQSEYKAKAKNAAEAVRFLVTNFPNLESYMAEKYYEVLVGEKNLTTEEFFDPIDNSDIHIVPVVAGAGGGRGFGRILLGGALIGASFLFPGAGLFGTTSAFGAGAGTAGKALFLTKVGTAVSAIGAGMVLNGVSEMLFPLPKTTTPEDDPRISFSFSGVQNTSRAGTSHPIVYGEIVTGSVVISAQTDTHQVST